MSARLVQVGVEESLARRFLSDEKDPTWPREDHRGAFRFLPWADGQAMASLTVSMTGEQHAVKVTIAALYEFFDGDSVPSGDESIRVFYREHMDELLPFLRQAVHTASSQVWPVKPIMLDVVAATSDEADARRST